jgi:hypothetical protein
MILAERKTTERKPPLPSAKPAPVEDAQTVARYLADMTAQLESMARAAKLELVAYLLAMARAEAESLTNHPASDPKSH